MICKIWNLRLKDVYKRQAKNIDKLDAIVKVLDDLNIVILLKELINIDEEIVKLKSKQDKLKKEVARSEGMLNNQNFLQKAPNSKIIEEKNKLSSYCLLYTSQSYTTNFIIH